MINLETKTRTRVTRNLEIKLSGEDIRGLVNSYFMAKGLDNSVPNGASITIRVPGGANWWNTELDICDDTPVKISWIEEEDHDE